MLETYDLVLTELILQGEVSETTSEPRLELSATDLGIFHGAMIEKPTTRPLVEKLKITNNDYPGKMALRANRNEIRNNEGKNLYLGHLNPWVSLPIERPNHLIEIFRSKNDIVLSVTLLQFK